MKSILVIAIGAVLLFASLWIGSYCMSLFTYDDWQSFPTFFTTLIAFCGGLALVAFGIYLRVEKRV